MSKQLPHHYRDNGEWCKFSGCTVADEATCPNGCEGALHHDRGVVAGALALVSLAFPTAPAQAGEPTGSRSQEVVSRGTRRSELTC